MNWSQVFWCAGAFVGVQLGRCLYRDVRLAYLRSRYLKLYADAELVREDWYAGRAESVDYDTAMDDAARAYVKYLNYSANR